MWSYISSIIIGAIAGWLGSKVVKGEGNGLIVNIFVGILGGILGNYIVDFLNITAFNFLGDWAGKVITGTIGSILLLLALRYVGSFFKKKGKR